MSTPMMSTPLTRSRGATAWPRRLRLAIGACLLAALAACSSAPARNSVSEIVVVRHAEKVADGSRDPALDPRGTAHADALARRLHDAPLVAAYATPLQRTRQTAAPSAGAHGLRVTDYDPALPAAELAARLRRAHPTGTVLVVGHSNTVPQIVAQLCGCATAPMPESDYGDLYRVTFTNGRTGTLSHEQF